MRVVLIAEGNTEMESVPTLLSKMGHVLVAHPINLHGIGHTFPWEEFVRKRLYPHVYMFAGSAHRFDKLLIILDRETRPVCSGKLAERATEIIWENLRADNLTLSFSVIIANPKIESWLFSQPELLDKMRGVFNGPVSHLLPSDLDECNVLNKVSPQLRQGCKWEKVRYAKALAQKIDLSNSEVQKRSRSLRKFIKEVSS